jgi:hypothetical protein
MNLDGYKKAYMLPRVGTTSNLTIHFVDQMDCFACDVKVRNLDSANSLTYRINNMVNVTVPAGVTDVITNTFVEMITIIPNAGTGTFVIEGLLINFFDLVKVDKVSRKDGL